MSSWSPFSDSVVIEYVLNLQIYVMKKSCPDSSKSSGLAVVIIQMNGISLKYANSQKPNTFLLTSSIKYFILAVTRICYTFTHGLL